MNEVWIQNLSNELHRPIRRNFPKRRVISYGIDKIWSADLVEMGKFSKWNKGFKYLLMVIDVFSKFGWIVPLKNKKGETVTDAFKSIITKRKPEMLWTDKGSEFFNFNFKSLLNKHGINLYSTENLEKGSVIERWNRTIKEKLWKMFSVNNSTVYLDKLDKLVDEYNQTYHSNVKMTPAAASQSKNETKVFANLYGDLIYSKHIPVKFHVGDKV